MTKAQVCSLVFALHSQRVTNSSCLLELGCHVPAGLLTLKRLLYALEGHKEEGIFRLSGSNEDIKQLQDNLTNYKNLRKDGHIHFDFVPENVHSVANLIIVSITYQTTHFSIFHYLISSF